MGSRFLLDRDGGDSLAGLTSGDFEANLASLRLQSLVASTPLKSTSERALTSGLISAADCSFTPLTGLASAGGTVALTSSGSGPIATIKGLSAGGGIALTDSSTAMTVSAPLLDANVSAIAGIGMREAWVTTTRLSQDCRPTPLS